MPERKTKMTMMMSQGAIAFEERHAPGAESVRTRRPLWQRMRSSVCILCEILAASLLPAAAHGGEIMVDAGRGPVTVHIPASYEPGASLPLVMSLHGYSQNSQVIEFIASFGLLVDEYEFIYVVPDGTTNINGQQFWNATDACCDFYGSGVDDSTYLRNLIDLIGKELSVDDRRIYIFGYSNGGFMAHRMACDHADIVAAIVSLAGVTYIDSSDCTPDEPVHLLQIHGTADACVSFFGGCSCPGLPPPPACAPGAVQTTETWAILNGCTLETTECPPLDIEMNIPGAETTVTKYVTGCEPGGSAELWAIEGAGHFVALADGYFEQLIIEHFLAHPKPSSCADLDGDKNVGITDLLDLLSIWGTYDPCSLPLPADLDGDFEVGVNDLLGLLSTWGACP